MICAELPYVDTVDKFPAYDQVMRSAVFLQGVIKDMWDEKLVQKQWYMHGRS